MKIGNFAMLLLACVVTGLAIRTEAADRVHAGKWDTTLNIFGRTVTRSSCMTQSDADAINGGEKSYRAYVEKVSAPSGCKVRDLKIDGMKVTVTSVCASGKINVGTTTYHGDSMEVVNTNGAKSVAKRVGACK